MHKRQNRQAHSHHHAENEMGTVRDQPLMTVDTLHNKPNNSHNASEVPNLVPGHMANHMRNMTASTIIFVHQLQRLLGRIRRNRHELCIFYDIGTTNQASSQFFTRDNNLL